MKLELTNEPNYRQKHFKVYPEQFDFKKEVTDKLWEKTMGNPNDFGIKLLPKYRENFKRRAEGKKEIPLTKTEKEFVENKIPLEWYEDFVREVVNDPRYLSLGGILQKHVNQNADEEDWLKTRAGIIEVDGHTSVKSSPMSPSGAVAAVYPDGAMYAGQSIVILKHSKQGLPMYGEENLINPDIAARGHAAEPIALSHLNDVTKRVYGVEYDLFPEPEAIYEHTLFGDYIHGNMDGVAMNLETMELEGVEVKSTDAFNRGQIEDYQHDRLSLAHLVQNMSYMSIRGFPYMNHLSIWGMEFVDDEWQWGLRPFNGMHVTRIERNLEDEITLLSRILWFVIEIVIKDGEIPEDEKYLSPEVLTLDLYTIYGKERTSSSLELNDFKTQEISTEYVDLLREEKTLKLKHKTEMDLITKQIAALEAKLIEKAKTNEKLVVKIDSKENDIYYIRTKKSKRFSSKLYDEALKSLKEGDITEEEFLELAKDRTNFENISERRSLSYWKRI